MNSITILVDIEYLNFLDIQSEHRYKEEVLQRMQILSNVLRKSVDVFITEILPHPDT